MSAGRVLVTGGGGFIGSHLVDRLLSEGHTVRVLDNFATGRRENLAHVADDIELIEGDIQSSERVHHAVRGCDTVLHQAALPSVPRSVQDPLTSTMINVIGTLNVLLAARDNDVRRVVAASSSSVYGADPSLPKRETQPTLPVSPYAVAKLAGEGYCRSFTHVYGLETVALRYFNVFGPRQNPDSEYAAVVPRFVVAARAGRPPIIYGDGEQSRDFTYIEAVVEANLLAMREAAAAGRTLNIAGGRRISLLDLWRGVQELAGTDIEPVFEPARPGDVRHSQADVTAAREVLGFAPDKDSFDRGLERTFASFAPPL